MIKNIRAPGKKFMQQNFRLPGFGPAHLDGVPCILFVWFEAGMGMKGLRISQQEGMGGEAKGEDKGIQVSEGRLVYCNWLVPSQTC